MVNKKIISLSLLYLSPLLILIIVTYPSRTLTLIFNPAFLYLNQHPETRHRHIFTCPLNLNLSLAGFFLLFTFLFSGFVRFSWEVFCSFVQAGLVCRFILFDREASSLRQCMLLRFPVIS